MFNPNQQRPMFPQGMNPGIQQGIQPGIPQMVRPPPQMIPQMPMGGMNPQVTQRPVDPSKPK
jgi:hypothetical protein